MLLKSISQKILPVKFITKVSEGGIQIFDNTAIIYDAWDIRKSDIELFELFWDDSVIGEVDFRELYSNLIEDIAEVMAAASTVKVY